MTPDDCSSGVISFIVSGNASQSGIIALRGAELVCSYSLGVTSACRARPLWPSVHPQKYLEYIFYD